MSSTKWVWTLCLLAILAGSVYANVPGSTPLFKESQVIIQPNEAGTLLNISVLTFEPATSPSGQTARDVMERFVSECSSEPDFQTCLQRKGLQVTATSTDYQMNLTSVQGAHIEVSYWNPQSASGYTLVPGCEDVTTDNVGTAYRPTPGSDTLQPVTYHYGTCDISTLVQGQRRTTLVARYLPNGTDQINPSFTEYTFNNAAVSPSSAFTGTLNNIIRSISEGGGAALPAATSLPCVGIFLIVGLLLSSLYFAGKSPISLLDITTPRLPAPKGVTAGGQILTPFGYGEMTRTAKNKMVAAGAALGTSLSALRKGAASTSALDHLFGRVGSGEGSNISKSILALGHSQGRSTADLERLARLPSHFGDAEHRTVAQILEAAERAGGRDRMMAMQIKDYMLGQRTLQSLNVLSGHPDVAITSKWYGSMSKYMDMAYGSNRYAILGTIVGATRGSLFRTGRVLGRQTKAIVTQAPDMARGLTKTTMEMVGGKHAVDRLRVRGRDSVTAAWLHKQVTKHPGRVVIGQMFPISEKMGHLYRTLHSEAYRDSMVYVLRQFYKSKKWNLRFDINEEELVRMGHTDVDILKRMGYKNLSPEAVLELQHAEERMRGILGNANLTSEQKLTMLAKLAEEHGAIVKGDVFAFTQKLDRIYESNEPDHIKMIMLQKELEEQNKVRMSVHSGAYMDENAFACRVGGGSLRNHEIWETMVLRTQVWDAEHGHLQGGIAEEAVFARLNVVNRITGLDATAAAAIAQLPEHMRNETQLQALAKRNREEFVEYGLNDKGKELFEKTTGKSIKNASMLEIVEFCYGGGMPKTGHIDKQTHKMVWWESDHDLAMPEGTTKVDLKRHWIPQLKGDENFAIGQWTESRFTRSYVPPIKASVEAELDRMQGSAGMPMEQRTREAKKLWVRDLLLQDMEQRFNSHFGQNTYGTTHETTRFYGGVLAGFLEKAMQEKGLEVNHPDLMFLHNMDPSNSKDLDKLGKLLRKYDRDFHNIANRELTYDDVAKSDKAIVMLHEGGYAYYKKGMMLSDKDRVLGGEVAIRDQNGQLRKFIPEDVPIKFAGREDLLREYYRVRDSTQPPQPHEWNNLIESLKGWKGESGHYDYDREKVFAHVVWQFANSTHQYDRFWNETAVSVEAKRQTTPAAPSPLRFFGIEAPGFTRAYKPFRDMGLHVMDYVSKVALLSGGPLHKVSYDITATSEYYKQHSWYMATQVMSGRDMDKLTPEERVAYRAAAMEHHAYHQVWDFAIDRNPWRSSTSFGTQQAWAAGFQFGPGQNYSVKDNLRAYLSRGEYANFMTTYGFPMNLAGKMIRPYTQAIRGMQMSMQGYASRWDSTDNALRQWNYTEPRLREAMQSVNPFSFRWFPGKTSERISKLNVFGGSLEHHHLAGPEFLAGLKQAPQDHFLQRKGVYANLRTGAANPGASFYNYRMELQFDAPMAEYLYRMKESTYMHDQKVLEAAMNNTVRRTVSAESLAIRRDQELRGFGAMQNPLFGWANPISFIWHAPIPLFPTSASPRDFVSRWVSKSKYGHGGSFSDNVRRMGQSLGKGTASLFQPHKVHMTVYCPRCYTSGYRGARCRCGAPLY